MSLEGLSKTA